MTPQEIEKAAEKECPRDLNYRIECDGQFRCGAMVFWKEGYSAGANLVMERVRVLEEANRKLKECVSFYCDLEDYGRRAKDCLNELRKKEFVDATNVKIDEVHAIARASLEGK